MNQLETTLLPRKRNVHLTFFSAMLPRGVRVPRLPYIGAVLRGYAESDELVRSSYEFAGTWDGRPDPQEVVAQLDDPYLFGFSCYVFNFEWTMQVAKAVREAFPRCIMIAGGPHVPDDPSNFFGRSFFDEYPWIDVLVHGEGEVPFVELLRAYLDETPDLSGVAGISYRADGKPRTNPKGTKLPGVIDLPSPWTAGYLDAQIESYREQGLPIDVLWETNRGCPYACSFCYWGTLDTNKLRTYTMERLAEEIRYFAEKKVDMVWVCDANFGILKRDLEIAQMLAESKAKTGYPRYVAAHHGKNTSDVIYQIIRTQQAAGQLYGGVWMARQSVSEEVLTAIKRPFAKGARERASEWKARFAADGTPVKVDLILGLPEETPESWFRGLGDLFRDGFHEDVHIHYLSLLPNTPLADQVETHQLDVVRKPFRLLVQHTESSEVIVGTRTMPRARWVECGAMSQLMLGMHIRGAFTRYVSIFLQRERDVPYERFYVGMLRHGLEHPQGFIGRLLAIFLRNHRDFADPNAEGAISDSIGEYVPRGIEGLFEAQPGCFEEMANLARERGVGFGPDQYIQMALSANAAEFYRELAGLVRQLLPGGIDPVTAEVLRFQQDVMSSLARADELRITGDYQHDWHAYFFKAAPLAEQPTTIVFSDESEANEAIHGETGMRRYILARVGSSWFERGLTSTSLSTSTMDGGVHSPLRSERGSA